MKKLLLHPLFIIGLILKIIFIITISPIAVDEWFKPFLENSTTNFSLDPWESWIKSGGSINAFPYGYAMWLVFTPLVEIFDLIGIQANFSYMFTLLIVDGFLLVVIKKIITERNKLILIAYWFSPVVILATYGLGLNDIIPVLFLTLSLLFIKRIKILTAGILLGAAISAKLSMLIALPFFFIYLFNNKSHRGLILQFSKGIIISLFIFCLPFIFSEEAVSMIINNKEISKILNLSITSDNVFSLYIVPLIYIIMIYIGWRIKRLNFNLFRVIIGITFLLIVLMTPASPGWFIWSIPFLVQNQANSDRYAILLITLFSFLYILSTLLVTPLQTYNGQSLLLNQLLENYFGLNQNYSSFVYTCMFATGIILILRIWREEVNRSNYFRLSRKPFVIGIAGDSGAGKDVFSDSLLELFGNHSVVKLSGDDYHLWDRKKPMWKVMTHLNPLANDLERYSNDLIDLSDGKSIEISHYDHETGIKKSREKVNSNDFIIASGLHTLYLPMLRHYINLKIFLDIDEKLRRYFKIKRDVLQRNHTIESVMSSIKKREIDSEKFIKSQLNFADIVFRLMPEDSRVLDDIHSNADINLKLSFKTKPGFNELSLNRVLVGICGLRVDMDINDDGSEIEIIVEGDVKSEDIEIAAKILCPDVFMFLTINPKWNDGMLGVMQLITISFTNQSLTKRFI